LITKFLPVQKSNDGWCTKKGDLQHAFPLNIPMVLSSAITIATDGEHLTCGGFSLSETVHLENFEFITDYFDGLSLSCGRGNASPAFMSPTHSGASTLR
jgi:hypothetical protein